VVIGTLMKKIWGEYPGLSNRLNDLGNCIDQMVHRSADQGYSGTLDLVVLPENAISDENVKTASDRCIPFDGPVHETFRAKARAHNTYIIAPLFLDEAGTYSNAAILVGRSGDIAGIYRKAHPVLPKGETEHEGGVIIGDDHPVFDCDFGRIGIQICFDIHFDEGWHTLAKKGAEIVAWPTQSPQTVIPATRAMQGPYYIVSSTWRNNATLFEPSGLIAAQTETDPILVHQIDLSYAILRWQPKLQQGALFTKHYGDHVGYHYSEREDMGFFWSNDPNLTIGQMVRELDMEHETELFNRYHQGL
jgi:predicted amidohydrolase